MEMLPYEGVEISADEIAVGTQIAFRWPDGWCLGQVIQHNPQSELEWDVEYEDGIYPQALHEKDRVGNGTAPEGSWVLLT